MAATIRLSRMGKKNKPFYRIVVANKRDKQNGRYIEKIGFYDPMANPYKLELDKNKLEHWIKHGAMISEGLKKLLKAKKGSSF